MTTAQVANAQALKRYYRLHAKVYDATRWSFLFGRQKIIELASNNIKPKNILEVGCGTGRNLSALAKAFPEANITGVDLSSDMLAIANKKLQHDKDRINLVEEKYDQPLKDSNGDKEKYDLILFSYALSMFNPGWDVAIKTAKEQLSEQGIIAVVDFQKSRFETYQNWMQVNHVRMEDHLLPELEKQFKPVINNSCKAYLGIWDYYMFIGNKKYK
jgi:S-adenosylmethionine-diacylgycerolhomoserine-N-methlytransferase